MKISISLFTIICLFFCACDDDKDEAVCGNGKIEAGEGCDGQAMPQKTCQDYGFTGGTLRCVDCSLVMTGCTKCGDFYIDEGEQCDQDKLNGQTCQSLGRQGGELACADDCTFDETACHDWIPMTVIVSGYSEAAGENVPLEGATVALDAPSGERIEQVTDAEGKTTFSDTDWTAGTTSLTIHKDGYALLTLANIEAGHIMEEMPVHLYGPAPPQPESVTLSGTFTGLLDPSRVCIVNVVRSPVATEWQGTGSQTWGVRVPRGQPFTLQAHEVDFEQLPSGRGYSMPIYQTLKKDFDAIDVNTGGAVLDFVADAVQSYTADVWISLPARADSPLRTGNAVCLVAEANSLYTIGWSTYLDISTDGNQFDASLLWTQPAWAEGVRTFCRIVNPQGSLLSIAYTEGYPQPGELNPLLDRPRWVAPANPTMAHPLHDPIEWELFDPGVAIQFNLYRGSQRVWNVFMAVDTETITLPAPPSSVDPATFLGTTPLTAYLYAYVLNEDGDRIAAYSLAQAILLTP